MNQKEPRYFSLAIVDNTVIFKIFGTPCKQTGLKIAIYMVELNEYDLKNMIIDLKEAEFTDWNQNFDEFTNEFWELAFVNKWAIEEQRKLSFINLPKSIKFIQSLSFRKPDEIYYNWNVIDFPYSQINFERPETETEVKNFVSRQRSHNTLIQYLINYDQGKYRLIPCHSAGIFRIMDQENFSRGPLIALPSAFADTTLMFWKDEIDEFEYLINKEGIKESELQKFFKANPKFLLGSEYDRIHSGLILQREEGSLIPDFLLEPFWSKAVCDILDIKLPSQKIIINQKNRERFSAAVVSGVAQLKEYADFFAEKKNRENILTRYGISSYKPKLYLVIGRSKFIDPLQRRKIEVDYKNVNVITYDDLLEKAKRRMLF